MHLLERYSLSVGARIDKPYIADKYFPLPVDKYITIHTTSKPAKTYDYFQEVVDLLYPILNPLGVHIIQIGAEKEKPLNGCLITLGQTSFGQVAYIIKNSLLHIGVDSFPVHFAGHYNKKLVALYSNNYINNVKSYFGDSKDQILLEPDRSKFGKPSFCLEEFPKTINTIPPDKIARHACDLLDVKYPHERYTTIHLGNIYNNKLVEVVPDGIFNPQSLGLNGIIVRMDIIFNENILEQQLSISKCSIVTDRPISENLLKKMRGNVAEIIYFVNESRPPSPQFVRFLAESKINHQLISDLKNEDLNKYKLDFVDLAVINLREWKKPDAIDEKNLGNYYYKSNKFIIGRNKIYQSEYDYWNDRPIKNIFPTPQRILPSPHLAKLWRESEYCLFFEKE